MVEAAAELAAGGPRLRLTHQTGERDVEMVRAAYRQAGLPADVEPFLYDMGRQLGQADVIVCRAGATTLAEITAAGKAGDSDSAADGDRRPPAQERRGAGGDAAPRRCCCRAELTGPVLARADLGAGRAIATRARGWRAAARALARPDAARVIVDRALELAQ